MNFKCFICISDNNLSSANKFNPGNLFEITDS